MRSRARGLAALAALCACAAARSAGGHFSVDDAGLLEPGECEQESWASRYAGGARLLHAGANCRVGPVEIGGAGEAARDDGRFATQWNLEVKWARELAEPWSVGLDLQPTWTQHAGPRYGTRFNAIATWQAAPGLAVNLNAGRDWWNGARNLARGGLAAEWQAIASWTLIAERYLESETHFLRLGARWDGGRAWNVDLSYAQRLAGPVPSSWSLGLTLPLGSR